MHRRRTGLLVLALLVICSGLFVGRVQAADLRQGDQCLIAADEIIDTDVYVLCNDLIVEGTINGDLIGLAYIAHITQDGHIDGDILLVAGQLRIDGRVDDDIRVASVDIDLTDEARFGERSDLSAIAINAELWSRAHLPGDFIMVGYQSIIKGTVGGNIYVKGSALVIEGEVQGEVNASTSEGDATPPDFILFPFPFTVAFEPPGLTVRSSGHIDGDLNYTSSRPGNISGRINGAINYVPNRIQPDITQAALDERATTWSLIQAYLETVLRDVLALMAAGILVMLLAPAWIREPAKIVPRNIAPSFGWGLILGLMAAPISLIVLLVSLFLVIIISAVTMGGFTWMALVIGVLVNSIVIVGFLFLIFYLAKLVIGDLIGRRLGRRFIGYEERFTYSLVALFIGASVYALLVNIPLPYVGLVINAIGIFIGLGAIALHARELYQYTFRSGPRSVEGPRPGTAKLPEHTAASFETWRGQIPASSSEKSRRTGPGGDNLPEGFSWWKNDK